LVRFDQKEKYPTEAQNSERIIESTCLDKGIGIECKLRNNIQKQDDTLDNDVSLAGNKANDGNEWKRKKQVTREKLTPRKLKFLNEFRKEKIIYYNIYHQVIGYNQVTQPIKLIVIDPLQYQADKKNTHTEQLQYQLEWKVDLMKSYNL
jgi:hypothetical protein